MEGEKLFKPKINLRLVGVACVTGDTENGLVEHYNPARIYIENNGKTGSSAENINIMSTENVKIESLNIGVWKITEMNHYYGESGTVHNFYLSSNKEKRFLDSGEYFKIDCDYIFPNGKGTLILEYESRAGSHYHASFNVERKESFAKDSKTVWWEKVEDGSHEGKLNRRGIFGKIKKECDICQYKQIIKGVK